MLRIDEAPLIEMHLLRSAEAPGGVGGSGKSKVMMVLINAVYAATGKTRAQAAGY